MKTNPFLDMMRQHSNEELLLILGAKRADYVADAIAAAEEVLGERGVAFEKKPDEEFVQEEKLKEERRAEEERLRMEELNNIPKTSLEDYFGKIAGASSISSANSLINEALELFASPDAIVLIRINSFGDYDRPTTAVEYLNYLKDSKEAKMRIYEAKYDDNNKITELELIKK